MLNQVLESVFLIFSTEMQKQWNCNKSMMEKAEVDAVYIHQQLLLQGTIRRKSVNTERLN